MSRRGATRWLPSVLAGVLALAAAGLAGAEEGSTRPPTNLKKVGDHWTPWDPPEPGPDAYIIQKGDTLWDLAGKWLGDPFLWPQVWDENRYILDSHWIYPGDPLVVPGRPTVVPEGGPPVPEEPPAVEEQPVEPPSQPAPPPMMLVADPVDVYCSGRIEPQHETAAVAIAGSEEPLKEALGTHDVIYLSGGRNQGVSAGDTFAVVRKGREVIHPTTAQVLGNYVRRLGRVRVMLTQEDTSTAMIEMACEDLHIGDELIAWEAVPIPRRASLPPFDRYDPASSGAAEGQIVFVGDDLEIAGGGHLIHTDLGAASGVKPGDVLTLFRERQDLPRTMIGQAIVLTVSPTTSMAKVAVAVRESGVGDRVEVAR